MQQERPKLPPLTKYATSQLSVSFPQDTEFASTLGRQVPHGYTEENVRKAISIFKERKLLVIHSEKRNFPMGHHNASCSKTISIPPIDRNAKIQIEGQGILMPQAELQCDLAIVQQLYSSDAALELYCPVRKALKDPTKRMNPKLSAWLSSSTETFLKKIDDISMNKVVQMPEEKPIIVF